jgi:hypothetical protein
MAILERGSPSRVSETDILRIELGDRVVDALHSKPITNQSTLEPGKAVRPHGKGQ